MDFPNGSGKDINMMYPTDMSYWSKLKEFVDDEPNGAMSAETRGLLAAIGIIRGKPFNPNDSQKELLQHIEPNSPQITLVAVKENLPLEALSRREQQVLKEMAAGLSNQQIADRLHISLATVKTHLCNVNVKLMANNRTEAAVIARRLGLILTLPRQCHTRRNNEVGQTVPPSESSSATSS